MLLDLIYRLTLEDEASSAGGNGKAPRDTSKREAKGTPRNERSGRADDFDDGDERFRERAREARREDREREKKEKVLHKLLRRDRRAERESNASIRAGGGHADADASNGHPHLLDSARPVGEKIAVTARSSSGETKLLQIRRETDLVSFFKAAKGKFKHMKKTPNVAKTHASPIVVLENTLSLAPGATVLVDFEDGFSSRAARRELSDDAGRIQERLAPENPSEEDTRDARREDAEPDAVASESSRRSLLARKDETSRDRNLFQSPEALRAENARARAAAIKRASTETPGEARLPAHDMRDVLVASIENPGGSPLVLVTGETGSGKTTQVPKFIFEHAALDENVGVSGIRVLVAQPRRVAATSVARRVAFELGENVGESVGYVVRGETRVSARTRITFMTTGVLLRRLVGDPDLRGVTHVFVDEVHERTADTDFLLSHLRDLLARQFAATTRADPGDATDRVPWEGKKLKVVLMSATMSGEKLAEYFREAFPKDAPAIPTPRIQGRTFPVAERFAEAGGFSAKNKTRNTGKGSNLGGRESSENSAFPKYADAFLAALPKALAEFPNRNDSILVFLPGAPEISRMETFLKDALPACAWAELFVVPLHGLLSSKEQQRAFDPAPAGSRKLVLATNVAETSLTIPDISIVFDCGRSKKVTHDPSTGFSSLKEGWCSVASATQRKGRAGRVRPGVCVRLYGEEEARDQQPAFDLPELQTMPLESMVMHAVLTRPLEHPESALRKTPAPPSICSIRKAIARLRAVGALAETRSESNSAERPPRIRLTPLGYHLAHLPVEPRVGKMLVYACVLGCLPPILTAVASMSCKPAFRVDPTRKNEAVVSKRDACASLRFGARSDHLAVAAAYEMWSVDAHGACVTLRLNATAMRDIHRERDILKRRLKESGFHPDSPGARANAKNDDLARCVLLAGLFPNVAEVIRGEIRGGYATHSSIAGGRGRGAGRGSSAGTRGRAVVRDHRGAEVSIHPGSVNGYQTSLPERGGRTFEGGPSEGYIVYQEAVETSRVFLRETTSVPVEALLLFGGDLTVSHSASTVSVSVSGDAKDQKITITSSPEVGFLFKLLRSELDRHLAVAAADPSAKEASLEETDEGRRVRDVLLRLFPGGSIE